MTQETPPGSHLRAQSTMFGAIALQALLLMYMVIGDFSSPSVDPLGGPSRFFGILGLYVLLLASGVMAAWMCKRYWFLSGQMLVPISIVIAIWLITSYFQIRYDAAQYQHLIGKTAAEIDQEFPSTLWRSRAWSIQKGTDELGNEYEQMILWLNGMQLYFENGCIEQRECKVVEVQ